MSEAEGLKAAIAELEFTIARLVGELKALQESDAVKIMDTAGATEVDWQGFFEQQREILEIELDKIVSDLLALAAQTEEIRLS